MKLKGREGQSLIEVLIGLAIGAILIGAASLGVVFILRSSTSTQYLQGGTQLTQDLVDRLRGVAAAKWQDLYNLTKGTSTAYFVNASGTTQFIVEGKEGVLSNEILDGLVGHWKFDEATSTATTTTYDASGNANHGTLTNGVTRATSTCKVSHCLEFDGTNDYVNISNTSFLPTGSASRSMFGWIKTKGTQNGRMNYFGYGGAAQNLAFDLSSGVNGDGKIYFIGYSAGDLAGTKVVGDGSWHHIGVTYDGTTVKIYVDGVLDVSGARSLNTSNVSTYPFVIGRQSYDDAGNYHYANARIDDVRIYNRALSADEIQRLYNSTVFTRYFNIENVNRDSNGDIVSSGGKEDPSTQKITAYVEWPGAGTAVGQVKVIDYLTRWANQIFNQSDWSGGPGQSGVITEPNNRFDNATSISNPLGSIRIEGL